MTAIREMTAAQKYELATTTYRKILDEQPALEAESGRVAQMIAEETGLDFGTAAVVALSAPAVHRD